MLKFYILKILKKFLSITTIKRSIIHPTSKINCNCAISDCNIDKYSYVGENSTVTMTQIGKFTSISSYCGIGGGAHPMDWVSTSPVFTGSRNILRKKFANHNFNPYKQTIIGNDVWIGAHSLIKSGVHIADGAIIGMGSVVTKDVGPYEVWCGNPAHLIKKRFNDDTIKKLIETKWWLWNEKKIKNNAYLFNDVHSFLNKKYKKRVLVLSSFPAPYRVGVFKELSKYFDLDIFFETNKNENRNKNWFCKNDDLHFEILNNKKSKLKYNKALSQIKNYDFVIAYDPARKLAIKAILKCQHYGIQYYVNNDGAFIKKNLLKTYIKKMLFKKARACFAGGKSSVKYFRHYGVDESKIYVHNFSSLYEKDILKDIIDNNKKSEIKEKLGIENKPTVICVGQFIYRKGFDVLIKAWKKIGDNAQLLLIGGGEEKENYEKYILEHQIKGVKILDFMEKDELYQYYYASDIFVLPTREDIWGLVINEAMACGLPVITTNKCNAGLELIENEKNGFIVQVDDSNELAEKIIKLAENQKLSEIISKNNLLKIKNYTIENVAKSHIDVINKTL